MELRQEASELQEYSNAKLDRVTRYLGVLADKSRKLGKDFTSLVYLYDPCTNFYVTLTLFWSGSLFWEHFVQLIYHSSHDFILRWLIPDNTVSVCGFDF